MKQTDIMFRTMVVTIIAIAMIGMTGLAAATQTSVTLEEKDGLWNIVGGDYNATVVYGDVGSEFVWQATGHAKMVNTGYSLIYYADKPNRFVNWGGDNPGALIGTFTTDGNGDFDASDSINLDTNLPCSPDTNGNASETNYTTTDGYANANGAKLWIVPSDGYDVTAKKLIGWNLTSYLLETDLIWYDDCSDFYEGEPANATFSIGDAFGVTTIPITITNATNVGAVDIVLDYDPSLVTVDAVLNGDMDSTYFTIGANQVTIGTAQSGSAGLNGDFTLASLNVTPVGTEPYNITMVVTTYKDATPCGRVMPCDISPGDGSPFLNGDVNGDGDVDMFDVMYLAKYIGGASGFGDIIEVAADVDGNGDIDSNDITYLARHIVGYPDYGTLL